MSKGLSNPVATAIVAQKATDESFAFLRQHGNTIAGTIVVLGASYYGYKQYKKWRKRKFVENNFDNPDMLAAMVMYKAMHRLPETKFPLSLVIGKIPDGTDEQSLYSIATKVNSMKNVIRAYKILFERSLIEDLNSDLSTSEMVLFYRSIQSKQNWNANNNTATIYPKKTPLYVSNPNGAVIYDEKGNYSDKKKFADNIGYVEEFISTKSQYRYDRKWKIDSVFGYGYVRKKDVTDIDPRL